MKAEITADYARTRLEYNNDTGAMIWKFAPDQRPQWNGRYSGRLAGSLNKDGYIQVRINKSFYPAHRLAWLITYGRMPSLQIDHINGVRTDNKISNLREVSHADNGKNQRLRFDNKSGHCGVYMNTREGKWYAFITSSRKTLHLGAFDVLDDAIAARRAAEKKFGFHQNHGKALEV